jgi:chromosome partitioning protein
MSNIFGPFDQPGRVLSTAIAKGGPGKTTTGINWGAGLAFTFLAQKLQTLHFSDEDLLAVLNSFLFGKGLNTAMVQKIVQGYLRCRALDEETIAAVLGFETVQAAMQIALQYPGRIDALDARAFQEQLSSETHDTLLIGLVLEAMLLLPQVLRSEVLFCEMDPQRNMSQGMGIKLREGQKTMHDVLTNPQFGISYATVTTRFGIDMIPATGVMSELEVNLIARTELSLRREYRLDDALKNARGSEEYPIKQQAVFRYPVIIIDPPPGLGQLLLNATVPVDGIVAILDMGFYSWNSMSEVQSRIKLVRQINPTIDIVGIVCNRFDNRPGFVDLCIAVEHLARQDYPGKVLESKIPYNSSIMKAPTEGVPVQFFKPESAPTRTASAAYASLAQETSRKFGIRRFTP